MILWLDGPHDVRENMRRDGALLGAAHADAAREPVLRLYRFAPPGITLGHAQDPEIVLDLARCDRDGVTWAVRPTGGRAIFHDQEVTYAFAAPLAHRDGTGSIAETYARLSSLIVRSLARLGVPASLAPGVRGARPGSAAGCFASTARHEIVIGDRKLAGSAQRRTARALLQQGSVLLGASHLRLADYLAAPPARREAFRAALESSAAHAGAWLDPAAPLERWAEALVAELPPGTRLVEGAAALVLVESAPVPAFG